eukprot:gnl/TRDRNA2_/TRDRNA2_134016_c0_seq1.p1 gnl/TRDRNA2_/TRDRNA2_134016_c0~~gnl/TRDRNA2_/TRDRNA2_134016_c0_seq1.p1  ORF type:complete len:657 (+),score=90.45 gnl/TRDRNA2_/TRDRNA2_134016_c0_seq1:3-1973(+)
MAQMAGAAKRAKLKDSEGGCDTQRASPAGQRDHLTYHILDDGVLMSSLADLLGSPYDWRFLRAASSHLRHNGKRTALFLARCVEKFKAELRTWDASKVLAEASKESPDGDKVLFALRMRHLLGARCDTPFRTSSHGADSVKTEMMLDAIKMLLQKRTVLGWPPVDDWNGWRFGLSVLRDHDSDDSDEDRGDSDKDDNDYDRFRLEDRGAVELIVRTMERWRCCPGVQEKGCFLLSKLWGPEDLRERCILLIRNAMDTHLQIPEVQSTACKAFKHFWCSNADFILSVESVNAICIAMKNFPSSLRVQHAACDFFRWVVPCSGKSEGNSKLLNKTLEAEAMKLMLGAVNTHIRTARFQRDVWLSITGLLRHFKDSMFFDCGGVSAMSTTLSRYGSVRTYGLAPNVCHFVLQAFRWACVHEEGTKHIDENVMQLALSALLKDCCIANSSPMVNCCKAFGHLAQYARFATWLSEKGFCQDVIKFMEESLDFKSRNKGFGWKHPEYTASMFVLTRLVQKEPLQVYGALRAVLWAMSAIPNELKLQVRGCEFVASLHWSPLNAVKASAFRTCDLVLGAMMVHAKEEALQEQGCLALTTLLAHDSNCVSVAKLNGVGTLVQAIESFPSNTVVQEQGRRLIKTMSESTEARKHSAELRVVALLS